MTSCYVNGQNFTLNYEAENRLVSVTGASTANFYYDADGAQVKTTVNGVTTYYVGNHYEVKNSVVTKYYFAGATRLAVRTNGTLSYLLGDHPSTSLRTSIGSSSVTTDANGVKTAAALYKAFGETRFSAGNLGTDYKFTGQREEASLGIYFFNARWFDPSLGRFTSPDTIVPTSTQGTQAWDRYAFVNNNPVRYNDPTGHGIWFTVGVVFAIVAVVFLIVAVAIVAPEILAGAALLEAAGSADFIVATLGFGAAGTGAGLAFEEDALVSADEQQAKDTQQDSQNATRATQISDMQTQVSGLQTQVSTLSAPSATPTPSPTVTSTSTPTPTSTATPTETPGQMEAQLVCYDANGNEYYANSCP
jgi:RHS repeat-associated protein